MTRAADLAQFIVIYFQFIRHLISLEYEDFLFAIFGFLW